MFFRRQQPATNGARDWTEAVREAGFEIEPLPDGRVKVSRGGCAAIVAGGPRVERWGWVVNGEIAALVDRGFQKFWRAGDRSVPALAQQLKALHEFQEDLREALGLVSRYNTSLGTTNDLHLYDRLSDR
ncbi:MAG TPA: hypothetical protein PLA43_18665 [Bryobacteraceae bacterium]|nr:hypothetical protein [Bryobacteraceae bacterium]HPQ16726.1 hypothetical protein [Bryobacteraceae bacterium]HPU73982.1 hypothetical protein [Bryobacteraceae bacterium]